MTTPRKTVFAVSLILNVLLAGMILGNTLPRLMPPAFMSGKTAELIARLPEDKRAFYKNTMEAALRQMDEARDSIAQAKEEALRLLRAEPFNTEAYMTQVQHIEDLHAQMKRHMADTVSELASHFSQQERAILADILSSMPPPSGAKLPPDVAHTSDCNQRIPDLKR